jgi:putative endonuclease
VTWFVYIIQSEPNGTLYTGVALDPDSRLRKHNGVVKGGAKATRAGRPWLIVYIERCDDKGAALRREAQIKKLDRKAKLALVGSEGGSLTGPQVE